MWKISKQGKASYCLVRLEIMCGMVLLLIVSMVSLIFLYCRQNKHVAEEGGDSNYEYKIQPPVESELSEIAECYLCGNNKRSLIGHYTK